MSLYLITLLTLFGCVMTSNTTNDYITADADADYEIPDLKKANISQLKGLMDTLLEDYSKDIVPTNKFMDTFKIVVIPVLIAIGDLDELEEKLSSVLAIQYSWTDESMTWNSANYNGINNVTIDEKLVWKPVFRIINMHHNTRSTEKVETKVTYYEDGSAVWAQLQVLDTTCNLDTTYFPFDIQICSLNLSISDYYAYSFTIETEREQYHLRHFDDNGAWSLNDYTIKGGIHSNLDITYVLHRKPLFIIVNVLLPIIVLTFLTPLVFLLPKGSGERIGYTVTILLAISVYMTILSDNLPANSDPMPNLSILLLVFYIITGLILLMVIMNTKFFNAKEARPVPLYAKRLVTVMHCVSRCESRRNKADSRATQYLEEQESCLERDGNDKEKPTISDGTMTRGICWSDVSNAMDLLCFCVVFLINATMFGLFFVNAYAGHGVV